MVYTFPIRIMCFFVQNWKQLWINWDQPLITCFVSFSFLCERIPFRIISYLMLTQCRCLHSVNGMVFRFVLNRKHPHTARKSHAPEKIWLLSEMERLAFRTSLTLSKNVLWWWFLFNFFVLKETDASQYRNRDSRVVIRIKLIARESIGC